MVRGGEYGKNLATIILANFWPKSGKIIGKKGVWKLGWHFVR